MESLILWFLMSVSLVNSGTDTGGVGTRSKDPKFSGTTTGGGGGKGHGPKITNQINTEIK